MTTYERFQFTRQRTKPIASISSLRHQLYYWKKIHWTCKWIILIEWRLLKKYVTCLHRDAVRKTDVHSFFFSFSFWLYTCGILKPGCTIAPNQYYPLSDKMSYDRKSSLSTRGSLCQTLVKNHKKKSKPRYSRTIPKTHFYRQLFIERYTRNCGFASKQPIKHLLPHQRIMKRITTELVLHYLNLYRFSIFNWIKFISLP